jgi:hypothetical protein
MQLGCQRIVSTDDVIEIVTAEDRSSDGVEVDLEVRDLRITDGGATIGDGGR